MKIAVMGYGTIGSGVVEVLDVNRDVIASRVGEPLEVKSILDLRDFPGDPMESKIVRDYMDIVNDPEIRIVVETMGGVEPAYTFVRAMLEAGKHVTTSNKALVADKGAELLQIAKDHNVTFLFEASVGGGIPIIRALLESLTGDVVEQIEGIVNGTTNYMLTKMTAEGSDFDEVLREAQDKGYAEKDPTADIEGYDACRKIAILTSLVCGKHAKAMGRDIKLLATSQASGDTYYARVAPFLLDVQHPLYPVNDVFNAVYVRGNMLGDAMFYGSGAGKLPTASAVVGDVVELAKHVGKNIPITWDPQKVVLADPMNQSYAFFVRTSCDKEAVAQVFGDVTYVEAGVPGEVGFTTKEMTQGEYEKKAAELGNVLQMIRLA